MDEDDFVKKFIEKFDTSSDSQLNEEEFVNGLSKLLIEDEDSADGIGHGRQNRFQNNSKVQIILLMYFGAPKDWSIVSS